MSGELEEKQPGTDENNGKNPASNVASRYFSVEVAPPKKPDGEEEKSEHNYFRMGAPDEELEGTLPKTPYDSHREAGGKTPWEEPGIVLFTTGKYQRSAKHSVTSTSEEVDVVSDGKRLVSATCTIGGGEAWEVSYKNLVDVTATIGYTIETTTGGIQGFWTGQYVHLGYGARMDGAFGSMIDVHGGQHIDLGVGLFTLEGLGHLEATENFSVISSGTIRLSSNPAHAHLADDAHVWRGRLSKAAKLALLISPALVALMAQVTPAGVWRADENSLENLKKGMIGTGSEALALAALFTVIHVGLSLAAAVIRFREVPSSLETDLDSATSVAFQMDGDRGKRSYLKVGRRWLSFRSDLIEIYNHENGTNGPTITVKADSITLSAGGSSIRIGKSGVTINGTAINCNGGGATLALSAQHAKLSGTQVLMGQIDAATLAQTRTVTTDIARASLTLQRVIMTSLPDEIAEQLALATRQQAELSALDSVG